MTFSFESADESPGFLLWQVTTLWQRQMRATLEPLGITHVQFVVLAGLAWLSQTEAVVTQVRLAHHARIDVMMTSQVIRTLEEKRLVERSAHPSDTRAKQVRLTATGHAVVDQAVPLIEATDRAFFAGSSDAAVQVLRTILRDHQ